MSTEAIMAHRKLAARVDTLEIAVSELKRELREKTALICDLLENIPLRESDDDSRINLSNLRWNWTD